MMRGTGFAHIDWSSEGPLTDEDSHGQDSGDKLEGLHRDCFRC